MSRGKALPKLPGRERQAARTTRPPAAVFRELADDGRLRTVALDAIAPNPRQPRRRFDDASLQGLADSIAERGVLQPPIVRPTNDDGRYELVAGERRWRAARLAGLSKIEVLVKAVDDAGQLEDAVLENVVRDDLSPIEEARAYATMIEDLGVTREEIGRRVGRSRVSVSNHLRLLDLPDEALELVDAGQLTFAHGRALLLCDDHATRRALARRAAQDGWSTRQLEEAARAAGAPRARPARPAPTAEQRALAEQLADVVSRASGVDVRVRGTAADEYSFTVAGADNARALAARLGADMPPGEL
jgi:ParB family transcriptional regulator, chromosome partitioning protein